jgi:hypothetical protein
MRTPEDPTRDPASEARDDHASEPRATPETDAAHFAILDNDSIHVCDELKAMASFARRLERQRDELLEALEEVMTTEGRSLDSWEREAFDKARAAIARVKGGQGE